MMRYAVLGAGGQLGRAICKRLGDQATALTRAEADLADPAGVRATLDRVAPEIVINCTAYNLVDRAESEPTAAFAINAWAVRDLAIHCKERNRTLVHYSTDYVFGLDESRRQPWSETDAPGPVSVYGLSKLAGEYVVRANCPRHFVIRSCGLYGHRGSGGKGGNFVETMLRVAGEGKPLRVVDDQICTPTSVADLAEASLQVLETGKHGLYHLTNSGSCSWYELAKAIFDCEAMTVDLQPIKSHEYRAAARRPAYSVLSNEAACAVGVPIMRPWREALTAYLAERRLFRGGNL